MKNKVDNQVELYQLIFTLNWEDPESDRLALDPQAGQTLVTVTSGGCNTLNLLLHDPEKIYAVDINPTQNWMMELKMAAIRRLDYDAFIAFLGLTESSDRLLTYFQLAIDLSSDARKFWDRHMDLIEKGFLVNGRYEKFVRIAGRLIRLLQGRRKTKKLLSLTSLEEQRDFFRREWNGKLMKWLFKLVFNKKRLAKKGLVAEYFHFDDGSGSFPESFYNRAKKALCDIPVKSNYFLSLYLTGKYQSTEAMPLCLRRENFEHIKGNLNRIELATADTKYWLEQMPAGSIDGFSLSNICELMSLEDTQKLFLEVERTARPGARICFRNLMIPREVPRGLESVIQKDEVLSRRLLAADRSFVYGKVAAYTVSKSPVVQPAKKRKQNQLVLTEN